MMTHLNYDLKIYLKNSDQLRRLHNLSFCDLINSILNYNAKFYIPKVGNYRLETMHDLHDILIACHLGF